jgi:nicotinamidase-related amidase
MLFIVVEHFASSSWQILDPVSALIVIDVQNDFISGSLAMSTAEAKQNGEEIVPVINKLLKDVHFDHVIYTRDWHPPDHISFHENKHKWKMAPSTPVSYKYFSQICKQTQMARS